MIRLARIPTLIALALCSLGPFLLSQTDPVPPSFFAVSPWEVKDLPNVKYGSFSHAQFVWPGVEPCRKCFSESNFAQLDAYVSQLQNQPGKWDPATNTVNMAITLGLTPSWALASFDPNSPTFHCKNTSTPGLYQCPNPPDDIKDWTDFVSALINRYNGIGHPHIRYYELWNEANDSGWWAGSIGDLVNLGAAAYSIIHPQDPYSQLLTPSVAGPVGGLTSGSADSWMDAYLAAGGAHWADAGAYHGYLALDRSIGTYTFPMPEQDFTVGVPPLVDCTFYDVCFGSVLTKAQLMRKVFDKYLPGKPMLQTEGGWSKAGITDPGTQVGWISRYYLLHASVRSTLNLQMAAWFAWDGPPGWGVIEDPIGSGTPTAAGVAYSQIYDWVVGAEIDKPCAPLAGSAPAGTWACNLSRGAGYNALAIWNTEGPAQYTPDPSYTRYGCVSDAGCFTPANPVAIASGSQVTIGPNPILLEVPGRICLLYDPTKAVKSGSTVALKIQMCDKTGTNLSSSALTLHAVSVVRSSTNVSSDVEDSGAANQDEDFRFDPTLGTSGGYVFNLCTKGLSTGTYRLNIQTVTNDQIVDSFILSAPFQVK